MSRLVAVVALAAGVAVITLIPALPSHACSCMPVTIEDAITAETEVAFVGKAIAVEDVGYGDTDHGLQSGERWSPMQWEFEVETVLKGDVHERIVVGTGYNSADCGVDFAAMGQVGVVAYPDGDGLQTGTCGGVWNATELIEIHGPGSAPLPGTAEAAGSPSYPLFLGAGLLVVLGSVLLARRNKS